MILLKTEKLKPHPQNTFYFDDIEGVKWNEFKESIRINGVIEPLIVAQDYIIVSGHQRLRAAGELELLELPCEIRSYENEEQIEKELIEINIRQRGDIGGSPIKFGRRIRALERIYGIRHGGDRKTNPKVSEMKQDELAMVFGISVDTLANLKKLTELIPEIENLVDTGIISSATALAIVKELSPEEQLELVSLMDVTKKITQKEVKTYIDENVKLKNEIDSLTEKTAEMGKLEMQLSKLKHELDNRPEKEIAKIPEDYESNKKLLENYKKDNQNLEMQFQEKTKELQALRAQITTVKESAPTEQFNQKLKDSVLIFCAKVATFIEEVGGYVWLAEYLNELPDLEKLGYLKSVQAVRSWANTLDYNLNNTTKEIN